MSEQSATVWVKSSYSGGSGGQCVELCRSLPGAVRVRDSKDPDGGELAFEAAAFGAFLAGVKANAVTGRR